MVWFPDISDKPAAMWLCHTLKRICFRFPGPAIYRQADPLITGYSMSDQPCKLHQGVMILLHSAAHYKCYSFATLWSSLQMLQFCYTQQLTASVTVLLHSAAHSKCYSFATLWSSLQFLQFCYTQQLTASATICYIQQLTASVTVLLHSEAHCKCYSFAVLSSSLA